MKINNIYDFFYQFLTNRGIDLDRNGVADFELIHSGLLDSFDLMSLLMEIELTLGCKLNPEQFIGKNKVSELVELLAKEQGIGDNP